MPPIISVIGNSGSGKTTLIERLIGELKSRGYRVATIKNA
ncbi:MAG: molybdopterin-guanine dinucleotide biosynthesis protein MobB, partial [Dehalococcoidales bacterium]